MAELRVVALPKRLARKSSKSTCSCRTKPLLGQLAGDSAGRATAQMPAAVVIWIALQILAADLLVVDLAGVGDLHELPAALAGDGAEDDDDVLERDRHGVFEDVLEHVAAFAEPQLVHQQRT